MNHNKYQLLTKPGFTIVELLVVIVVIGILATIALVSYSGIQASAGAAALKSDLKQAQTQLEIAKVEASVGAYPSSEDGLAASDGTNYEYDTYSSDTTYCLTAWSERAKTSFHISSTDGGTVKDGPCPGHTGYVAGGGQEDAPWDLIAAGYEHTCAVTAGKAYCWGYNSEGELGNNSTIDSPVPVAVDTSGVLSGKTITSISADSNHTCVLASGGVYCWGWNNSGQLGNNSTTDSHVPVAVDASGVLSGKTITRLVVGGNNTCVFASGQVYCWGSNSFGELGTGTMGGSSTPVAIDTSGVLAGKTITDIKPSRNNLCAVASGQVFCWGYNQYGQLGDGTTYYSSAVAVAVNTSGVLSGKTVTGLGAGDDYTCALASGQAYCWGINDDGQLGNNSEINALVPAAVNTSGVLAGKSITSIALGGAHACALASGQVYCWGTNWGLLGNNAGAASLVPVAVYTSGALSGKTVTSMVVGDVHTCVLASGQVYCWGWNSSGQLGNNSTDDAIVPTAISSRP